MSEAAKLQPARSSHAMAVSSQPLATETGLSILRTGGNAIDAAIAMAAVLNVVDPQMTGIGGDAFALVYHAATDELAALNATGRAPYGCSLEYYTKLGWTELERTSIHPVTTPGALDGWATLLERFGTLPLGDVLEPAIRIAKDGFAINNYLANWIRNPGVGMSTWQHHPETAASYLIDGRAPDAGEVLRQPNLANTFQKIAEQGPRVFYEGEIADEIERFCQQQGGFLSKRDLKDHRSDWVDPINTTYRGYTVYEFPPNSVGLVLLEQLNLAEGFEYAALGQNSAETIHRQIESKKRAFADLERFITDPAFSETPVASLLSKDYAARQRATIDVEHAAETVPLLDPALSGENTIFLCVVDEQRNVVSFINSLAAPWGCGMVAGNTGILLHNRGIQFSLNPNHVNRLEPHKRPLHTLNPVMVFLDGKPSMALGCAGAFQQTQGLLQILVNVIDFGMNPQEAIAAPRWSHIEALHIDLEEGIGEDVRRQLTDKGHQITGSVTTWGVAQMIAIEPGSGELSGATETRTEGLAKGY